MTDKKKSNMSEKKNNRLIFVGFVVSCVVVFFGFQMYDNIKLVEKCEKKMVPRCVQHGDFTSTTNNEAGDPCLQFDWYEAQSTLDYCPISKEVKTSESKK